MPFMTKQNDAAGRGLPPTSGTSLILDDRAYGTLLDKDRVLTEHDQRVI